MWVITLTCVETGLPPHTTTRSASGISRASTQRVAQAMDAVALHQPHGAGVVMRPHRLRPVAPRGLGEGLGDAVERLVPGDRHERCDPYPLVADAAQRRLETLRVVLPLGIARDLGADHARRIGMILAAVDPSDRPRVEPLHLERAGARAIMRADGVDEIARQATSRAE